MKTQIWHSEQTFLVNNLENNAGNGALAHEKQMLHISQ